MSECLVTETRHKRTRNGCLTCRQRLYKCDETIPVCKRWRRIDITCTWTRLASRVSGVDTAKVQRSDLERELFHDAAICERRASPDPTYLSTVGVASLSYYMSRFVDFSFDLQVHCGPQHRHEVDNYRLHLDRLDRAAQEIHVTEHT